MNDLIKETKIFNDIWLTEHLGKNCFHLDCGKDYKKVIIKLINDINEEIFVDTKISTSNNKLLSYLQSIKFKVIDCSLSFVCEKCISYPKVNKKIDVRKANNHDLDSVLKIASSSFSFSRFHQDINISCEVANKIKKDWAHNFFRSLRGDLMYVAFHRNEEKIVGFILLNYMESKSFDKEVIIDLIAIDKQFMGRGIAKSLLKEMFENESNKCLFKVGTQVSNIPAISLYSKFGFILNESNYALHLHKNIFKV
tara:strand:- start:334 stop:1092 length:759 start_codon:yes stop_codon:yes gene_type:complete